MPHEAQAEQPPDDGGDVGPIGGDLEIHDVLADQTRDRGASDVLGCRAGKGIAKIVYVDYDRRKLGCAHACALAGSIKRRFVAAGRSPLPIYAIAGKRDIAHLAHFDESHPVVFVLWIERIANKFWSAALPNEKWRNGQVQFVG